MARVVNKNPNASTNVNGIAFTERNGFMVSVDDVQGEDLDLFLSIPGFHSLDEKPKEPEPPVPPETPPAPPTLTEAPAPGAGQESAPAPPPAAPAPAAKEEAKPAAKAATKPAAKAASKK